MHVSPQDGTPAGQPSPSTGRPPTWFELRVHGVSGTPVVDLLGLTDGGPGSDPDPDPRPYPDPVQVAGGERGGFWRRGAGDGARTAPPDPDGRVLEAYHWGGYTERSPGQGLWILLLPFGIVNAAQFMLPAPGGTRRLAHDLAGVCLRLLALVTTVLMVLGAAYVVMDRIAWQALGSTAGGAHGWLAAGATAPLAVLAWLRRVGNVIGEGMDPGADVDPPAGTRRVPADVPVTVAPLPGAAGEGLAARHFYVGDPTTPARTTAPALRWLHLSTGVAVVALLVAWPAAQAQLPGGPSARWVGIAVVGLLAAVVAVLGDPEERVSVPGRAPARARSWWHAAVHRFRVGFFALAVVAFVLAARSDLLARAAAVPTPQRRLPGIDGAAAVLLVATAALLVVLFLATLALGGPGHPPGSRAQAFQRYARGTTAALAAAVGVFVGIAYTGGAVTLATAVVNVVTPRGASVAPRVIRHISLAWAVAVAVAVLLGAALLVTYLGRRRAFRAAAARDLRRVQGATPDVDPDVVARLARRMFLARTKNLIPRVIAVFAGLGTAMTVAAGIDLFGAQWLPDGDLVHRVETSGAAVLAALVAAVLLVANRAQSQLGLRRGLNVVWDVISFWPRSVHPFTPVAYSQFVVAQLRRRISALVDPPDAPAGTPPRQVVLAAHSQGTLIAAAALAWVPATQRPAVSFLSAGSQLQVIFPRAFPAYVDLALLDALWDGYGGRWRNLYRETDPLAGPVLSWTHRTVTGEGWCSSWWERPERGPDLGPTATGARVCGHDLRLRDPRLDDASPTPTLYGHGSYWLDPEWPRAVRELRGGTGPPATRPSP